MDDYERYLIDQLQALHREYRKLAQPFIDKLVAIEACKPRPPVIIDASALTEPHKTDLLRRLGGLRDGDL